MNPREIGSLLFSHPEVAEVCVLTAPSYHAFVVLAANAAATLDSLRALCDGHGAQADGLGITLLDEMPKTRHGRGGPECVGGAGGQYSAAKACGVNRETMRRFPSRRAGCARIPGKARIAGRGP